MEKHAQKNRLWLGGDAPQTPRVLAEGGKAPPDPFPKRSSAAFDRGGQTGSGVSAPPPTKNRGVWGAAPPSQNQITP